MDLICGFRLQPEGCGCRDYLETSVACVSHISSSSSALTAAVAAQPQPARSCSTTCASSTAPAAHRSRTAASSCRASASPPSARAATVAAPANAERIDLAGKTVIPGLIDLHFHIENDPRLALRQLSHGVTSFRDPGQWDEKFVELRRMIAADRLPGPAHLHRRPAHRRRAPGLSRRRGRRARRRGGAAACAETQRRRRARRRSRSTSVCRWPARGRSSTSATRAAMPCTAHLEILDARELIRPRSARRRAHHLARRRAWCRGSSAKRIARRCCADNDARRDGRYAHVRAARPRRSRGRGALRGAASSGGRGSIPRSPCSSGAPTRRPTASRRERGGGRGGGLRT